MTDGFRLPDDDAQYDAPARRRDGTQYLLRLPTGLRERVQDMADKNGRSLNSEIVAAIEEALTQSSNYTQLMERVAVLEYQMASLLGLRR